MREPGRLFAAPVVELGRRADGTILLRTPNVLSPYARSLGEYLVRWSRIAPNCPFLLERAQDGAWRAVTYLQALERVERIAAGLLKHGLSEQRPVVILSDNSIDHALLMLAAMHVGIPSVSVSSGYSLLSADHAKLKRLIDLVTPGLIFASDPTLYARAIQAVRQVSDATFVTGGIEAGDKNSMTLATLESTADAIAVAKAFQSVGPNTIAKLLFTSGSTDEPKGVINTQRMLCCNQQARAQVWPFLHDTPPVLVDWLPWSHTFGSFNLNMVLRHGGTLYIDGGRPTPALIDQTVRNLREIQPTIYCNVPRGYDMLVAALRTDEQLRKSFFARLQVIFYAGAALPQNLWDALQEIATRTLGEPIALVSAWGSTETAPLVTDCHFQADRTGVIGVPVPGCDLKLIPNGAKLEIRVRGPNVTPGYWKRPDLTVDHFDEEGFYRIGDAVRFVDSAHPERGLLFDGRVSEDFKLDSGTWVNVGMLRVTAIAALAPIVQDIVLTGHDRGEIGFLIFPNLAACRQLCPELGPDAPVGRVLSHLQVRKHVANGLAKLRAAGKGSSTFAARALLMVEPPTMDAGEITDKGYINQRAVLTRRAALVDALYAETNDSDVIRPEAEH